MRLLLGCSNINLGKIVREIYVYSREISINGYSKLKDLEEQFIKDINKLIGEKNA
jgi:hypothetical protein